MNNNSQVREGPFALSSTNVVRNSSCMSGHNSRYNVHHFVTRLSEVPRLSEFWQPLHFQLCASFHGKFVRVAKVARGLTTSPLSIMCI